MELVDTDVGQRALAAPSPPTQLAAESIGCRVPRAPREGWVEAVFQRACNVALAGGGMITVLVQNAGNVPHGVRLTCSPRLDRTLRVHMPVRLSHERIVFAGGAVVVRLDGASTWTSRLQPGLCAWDGAAVETASHLVRGLSMRAESTSSDLLRTLLGRNVAGTPLAKRFGELLSLLSRSSQSRDPVAALACIAQLIGLGPGLTPAGDDCVIGWLAGLTLGAVTRERLAFLHAVRNGMAPLHSKTPLVSWQHVDDARALMFSERLADLCLTIADGAPAPVLAARLDAQLAVGASSGADAAAGLLFALRESCPQLRALFPKSTH